MNDLLRPFLFLCLGLFALPALSKSKEKTFCDHIHLKHPVEPEFSKNELRWLCGDSGNRAYAKIPLYQASLHLRAFLEQRGYTHPTLTIEDGQLNVDPGNPTRVQKIEVVPADSPLNSVVHRFRKKILSPKLLNQIEAVVQRKLLETGYPCATVTSLAVDGNVTVTPKPGPRQKFGPLEIDPVEGLVPEAFLRFQPFSIDDPYDRSKLDLYERRLRRQNVVQGTYFQDTCERPNTEFSLHQSFLVGPPRTVKFGVGVNTEAGPLLQAIWSHDRYRSMASHLSTGINLSLIEQTFFTQSDIYVSPQSPRWALSPNWRISRVKSKDTVEVLSSLELLGSRLTDLRNARLDLAAGPAFVSNWFITDVRQSYHQESSVALLVRTQIRSHTYEIYDYHPQRGYEFSFNAEYRDPKLGFPYNLLKTQAQFHKMFFIGELGRGTSVLAVRVLHANTWTNAQDESSIAPSLKSYLGGYDNLRGFAPKALPKNNGLGALSTLAGSIEFRAPGLFADKWEPYAFLDIGRSGETSMNLDSSLYSAYGLGLRWISPIGLVQGYVSKPRPGSIYLFAALGGEF